MGAKDLFETSAAPNALASAGWQELSGDFKHLGPHSFKQNVVDAHEELAQVPGPLSDCFRAVANQTAQELAGEQARGTP